MSMKQEPLSDGNDNGSSSGVEQLRRFGPGAVVAAITLLFIVQNQVSTKFEFLWFEFTTGLWLMLLISVLAGAVIGWFVARRRARRKRRKDND